MNNLNQALKNWTIEQTKMQTFTHGIYQNGRYVKPDSKSEFLKLGKKIQMFSLATKSPKITLQKHQEIFNQFLKDNFFIEKIQFLEEELYAKGKIALGIENNCLVLKEIIDFRYENNQLVYLLVVSPAFYHQNYGQINLISEYDLSSKNGIVKKYFYDRKNNQIKDQQLLKSYQQETLYLGLIPYVVFKNNAYGTSDMENVNPEFFEMLNVKYENLMLDAFYSSPLPEISWNNGGDNPQHILKALFSLDSERLIKSSSLNVSTFLNKNFEIHQSPTQSQAIISSIESIRYWIKDSLVFKKNSADQGTKNLHTAEAEQLNSNFEDYIESKANLREIYYEKFVKLCLRFLNLDHNQKIDVIVTGSTKWLIENAKVIQSDQNGVIVNKNHKYSQNLNEKEVLND